jgi:hypothetical protein
MLNYEVTHPRLLEKQYGISVYEIKQFMHSMFDTFPEGLADFAVVDKPLAPPQFKNKFDPKLSTLKDQISGLTQGDIDFMKSQSQSRKDFYWNNHYLPGKQLLSYSFLPLDYRFCAFSLPLFTQNRQQVFIEYAFYRDDICGVGGFITFYLDADRKWRETSVTIYKSNLLGRGYENHIPIRL